MAGKSAEERLSLIDQRIAKKKEELEALEEKRYKLLHPISMRAVLAKAKEAGMTPDEVAERLGLEI